ncbi:hypothetical protein Tco_1468243 [Tanacetum coccineum]
MVTLVDGVLANGVVMIFEMDIAFYAIQGTKILSLMIRLRILSIILPIFHTHLHNPNTYHTLSSVEDLVHTLSESDGISKSECDLTICNDSSLKKDEVLDDIISIPPRNVLKLPPCVAITPVLFTEEPVDSLIMEDEHLDTIPETESDELIKSSVEDLVQIPSESEDSSEGECDLPPDDDSSKNHDLTFSNPLFDIDEDFTSSDESFSEEDVPNENFKIFSNPLFDLDEEITSTKVDQIDDEIDSLLDEFTGELTLPHSIPPGIDPEGDILFLESLLYDNSSPRPPEEFNSENPTESFSPSPIPVEDSDSLMEDIDIFLDGDDSMPPDQPFCFVKDIPVDVPHHFCRTHPALQLDFDFIPSNDLGSDLDVSSPFGDSNKIYDPGICIEVESTRILATLSPVINTLLPFSSENEDKVFNHGVLAYKEKSPPYSSYRGLKALQLSSKSPMLIHGDNTPDLGVRHPHFYPL